MTIPSNIYMIPAAKSLIGTCGVCGVMTRIRFQDQTTGQALGECCVRAALEVDRLLSFSPGICHPTIEAVTSGAIPNN